MIRRLAVEKWFSIQRRLKNPTDFILVQLIHRLSGASLKIPFGPNWGHLPFTVDDPGVHEGGE